MRFETEDFIEIEYVIEITSHSLSDLNKNVSFAPLKKGELKRYLNVSGDYRLNKESLPDIILPDSDKLGKIIRIIPMFLGLFSNTLK